MKTYILWIIALIAACKGGHADAAFGHIALLGAVVNQATLGAAFTSFKTIFQDAYTGTASSLTDLAITVPSTTRQEEYRWLGQFPGLREWIGDRVVKDLSVDGFVIKNRNFEATVSVDRNDLEDDAIGIYKPLFSQLGESAKQHPDLLMYELLMSGFTAKCFDGNPFFHTAHPNGSQPAYSNKGTAPLDVAAYEAARTSMTSLVNTEGRPLRLTPTFMLVPPQLEATAKTILRADKMANGATNIWQASADVIVVPELAAHPTCWFLADLKHAGKPFIFQTRKTAEFMALDQLQDENVFFRKEFIYGVDYRGNCGFGLPHLMYGSTGGA